MKKTVTKEIIWLAAIFILSFIVFEFLQSSFTYDINLHDTYIDEGGYVYTLSTAYLALTYFITISFWIYLIRATYWSFKVVIIDAILLFCSGILILYNARISLHDTIATNKPFYDKNTFEAPVKGLFYGGSFSTTSIVILYAMKILIVLAFGLSAYMIGKNTRKLS